METFNKEEIVELVRKEFENSTHPNIKDSFDLIWDIHEKYSSYTDTYYSRSNQPFKVGSINLSSLTCVHELTTKLSNYSKDYSLDLYINCDDDIVLNLYENRQTTIEEAAHTLCQNLCMWANSSIYGLYKKLHFAEKENVELKKQLRDEGIYKS